MKSILRPLILISALFVFLNWQNHSLSESASEEERNKKVYLESIKIFETGETDSLYKYITKDYVDHSEPFPGVTSEGLQRIKDNMTKSKAAFPDVKITIHHIAVDGDLLMAYGSWKGTNTGDLPELPATGKNVQVGFITILRFENGKAAEEWKVSDQLGLMVQLDVLPNMKETPSPINLPAYDWNVQVPVNSDREEQLKKNYRELLKMIESGNLTKLDKYLSKDIKENIKIPNVTLLKGIEGSKQIMNKLKLAYPDAKFTVNYITVEGDILIAHTTIEGTYAGTTPGYSEKFIGLKTQVPSVDIVQFNAEGKVIAHWNLTDRYEEMTQLGIFGDN